MRKEEYLQILTEQIRCKRARGAVQEEIKGHIEDQKSTFLSGGMEDSEAEDAAVREMGDPIEAGNELDRLHRPRMAWGMIGLIAALSIGGLMLQYLLKTRLGASTILVRGLGVNLFYMIIGLGLVMTVCYLDYSRIGYWAKELMILLSAVMLIDAVLFKTLYIGRYYFTIPFWGISISYTHLFLLFVPLYAGVLYGFRGQGRRALAKSLVIMLVILVFAAAVPSTLTVIVLLPTFLVTLSIAVYQNWFHISRKATLIVIWAGAALLPFAVYFGTVWYGTEYQSERMQSLFNPAEGGAGYQTGIIRELIADSRLLGADPGKADSWKLLPESWDYVMTYVAAYYGILAVALLAALIAFLFFGFLKMSMRQKNQLGMLMGVSCSVVFLIQLGLYILGNLGILPPGEVYCPFVTNGGAGMLVTYILLGLILSIYRYQNVIPQKSTAAGKKMRAQL